MVRLFPRRVTAAHGRRRSHQPQSAAAARRRNSHLPRSPTNTDDSSASSEEERRDDRFVVTRDESRNDDESSGSSGDDSYSSSESSSSSYSASGEWDDNDLTTVTSYSSNQHDRNYWTDDDDSSIEEENTRAAAPHKKGLFSAWRNRTSATNKQQRVSRAEAASSPFYSPRRNRRRRFRFRTPKSASSDSSSDSSMDNADQLKLELEDLGYDLDCESFITKKSPQLDEERYGRSNEQDEDEQLQVNEEKIKTELTPKLLSSPAKSQKSIKKELIVVETVTSMSSSDSRRKLALKSTRSVVSSSSSKHSKNALQNLLKLTKSRSKNGGTSPKQLASVMEHDDDNEEEDETVSREDECGNDNGENANDDHVNDGRSQSEATWEGKMIRTRVSSADRSGEVELLQIDSTNDEDDDDDDEFDVGEEHELEEDDDDDDEEEDEAKGKHYMKGIQMKRAPSQMTNTSSKLRGSRRNEKKKQQQAMSTKSQKLEQVPSKAASRSTKQQRRKKHLDEILFDKTRSTSPTSTKPSLDEEENEYTDEEEEDATVSLQSLQRADNEKEQVSPRPKSIVKSPMQRELEKANSAASESIAAESVSPKKIARRKFFATPLAIEVNSPAAQSKAASKLASPKVASPKAPSRTASLVEKLIDEQPTCTPTESFVEQPKSIALSPNGLPEDDAQLLQALTPRTPANERLPPPPPKICTSPMDLQETPSVVIEGMSIVMGMREEEIDHDDEKPQRLKKRIKEVLEKKEAADALPKKTKAQVKEEKALQKPWSEPSPLSEPNPNPKRLKAKLAAIPAAQPVLNNESLRPELDPAHDPIQVYAAHDLNEGLVKRFLPFWGAGRKTTTNEPSAMDRAAHLPPRPTRQSDKPSHTSGSFNNKGSAHQQGTSTSGQRQSSRNYEDLTKRFATSTLAKDPAVQPPRNRSFKLPSPKREGHSDFQHARKSSFNKAGKYQSKETSAPESNFPISPRKRIDDAIKTLLKQKKEASKFRAAVRAPLPEVEPDPSTESATGVLEERETMPTFDERPNIETENLTAASSLVSSFSPNAIVRRQNLDGVRALVGTWFSDAPCKGISMDSPAFFETVTSPRDAANGSESIAPGNIEVTYDQQVCLVNSDLRPIAKLDDGSSLGVRRRAWSPVKRTPKAARTANTPKAVLNDILPASKTPIYRIDPVECFKEEGEAAMTFRSVHPASRIEVSGLPPKKAGFKVRNIFSRFTKKRRNTAVNVTVEDASMPTTQTANSKRERRHATANLSQATKEKVVQSIFTPRPNVSTRSITDRSEVLQGDEDILLKLKQDTPLSSENMITMPHTVCKALETDEKEKEVLLARSGSSKRSKNALENKPPLPFTRNRSKSSSKVELHQPAKSSTKKVINDDDRNDEKTTATKAASMHLPCPAPVPAQRGMWQDFMNMDVLGAFDWTKSSGPPKLEHDIPKLVSPAPQNVHVNIPKSTGSLKLADMAPLGEIKHAVNAKSPLSEKSYDTLDEILSNRTRPAPEPSENLPPVKAASSKPVKVRSFFGVRREPVQAEESDKMSIGISSKDPSSFFPVEFNDDNDIVRPSAAKGRPTLANGASRGPSVPLASTKGILRETNKRVEGRAPGQVNPHSNAISALLRKRSEAKRRTEERPMKGNTLASSVRDTSTLTSFVGLPQRATSSRLSSALSEDTRDTWAEIADASQVVERAMDRLDTFKSEDEIDDPARLKALLASVSDDQSIGNVEKALDTLRKHATRLGVKEADLLLAVESTDTMSFGEQTTKTNKSYKDMTLAQEIFNVLSLYMKGEKA
ncbi:hypothetical protein MPSEU_001106700 [Mayamaea pseudoterrestris]|nr:hypothetical protein MPSEU_001106700 [Mayamaea pseudoterrestris]